MLGWRAFGHCCKDGASDVTNGIEVREAFDDEQMIDITPPAKPPQAAALDLPDIPDIKPRKSSALAKRDGTAAVFNDLRAQIAAATSSESLEAIKVNNDKTWADLPSRWVDILNADYEMAGAGMNAAPSNSVREACVAISESISLDMLAHVRDAFPDADWNELEPIYDRKADEMRIRQI